MWDTDMGWGVPRVRACGLLGRSMGRAEGEAAAHGANVRPISLVSNWCSTRPNRSRRRELSILAAEGDTVGLHGAWGP